MTKREKLIKDIEAYTPFNEQEEKDKEIILSCLKNYPDIFTRDNKVAHMTASSWILDKERKHVLMCYHNIYKSWSWLGGHADGEEDLLAVSIKEAEEESSLTNVTPLSDEILSLEVLTVDGHIKRGEYVSSHLHLNVTYLLTADIHEELHIKADENSGVRWFTFDDALKASTEPWFVEHIYSKLIEKAKKFTC